ncbi:MAG: hypothetical protein H6594_07325 [Flavobacteriales bacterium]|nr:hypothetical protein [Flavobacteriales bacterium]
MARWLNPTFIIVLLGLLLLAMSNNINWGGDHWRSVLQVDARGYHAYLPAVFIHQDPNLGFFDAMEKDKYGGHGALYDYRTWVNGRAVDKYFAGTAVCEAPFFLIAHAWTLLTAGDADGYAKPYVIAINIAAVAYVLLGLWAIDALMRRENIPGTWRSMVAVTLVLGTPMVYYAVVAPGMSHAYSFGLCAFFLLTVMRWIDEPGPWRMLLLGGLLGLIMLVRPVNALIVLLVPVFAGDRSRTWGAFARSLTQWPALIGAVLIGFLVVGIQGVYYHAATGSWWVDSYPEEGFHWSTPHMADMLFSYKKGLFVYSPVLLLATIGLYTLAKRSVFRAIAWGASFLLITYVLSCWWNWWYGGSFGQRVWLEYLPLFALPLAHLLERTARKWRPFLVAGIGLLLILCQFQIYQARYYVIHWEDMDKARYWDVFLKMPEEALSTDPQ